MVPIASLCPLLDKMRNNQMQKAFSIKGIDPSYIESKIQLLVITAREWGKQFDYCKDVVNHFLDLWGENEQLEQKWNCNDQ